MENNTNLSTTERTDLSAPRTLELETFASSISWDGSDVFSRRVFNIWGESGVGKTSFIKAFRDSELVKNKKVLFLYPTEGDSVETIEEFIAACAETVRYPSNPTKGEIIEERLENVQRGKVNPMISDDSILIARSSIATNKKPYVNKAAAASVGRTEFEHEDLQVQIGLGESKADNQAEGFLDALPLQSLGTDVIFLILGRMEELSISIKDWIRDYVIPAASKGAYRRNIVIITESESPFELHSSENSLGSWKTASNDFRLYPLVEDEVYELALSQKIDPGIARFIFIESLGYPQIAVDTAQRASQGDLNESGKAKALSFLDQLEAADRLKIAAACLPKKLYPEELDALYGKGKGASTLSWLKGLIQLPIEETDDGNAYSIDDNFRWVAIEKARSEKEFKTYRNRWAPYGRVVRNTSSKACRSKLALLSGLNWMDTELCSELFDEKTIKVQELIENKGEYFIRKENRFRITDFLRRDLNKIALNLHPAGSDSIHDQALELWEKQKIRIKKKIEDAKRAIKIVQEEIHKLTRKQIETNAHLRAMKKKEAKGEAVYPEVPVRKENGFRGPLIFSMFFISLVAFASGMVSNFPSPIISVAAGLIALFVGIALIPGWKKNQPLKKEYGMITTSSGIPIRGNLEMTRKIREREIALEELQNELARLNEELSYSYIEEATPLESLKEESNVQQ